MKDYAKIENMDGWLRHPVLGDPSFDTFERLGDTVHHSEPPYEWAVNGSLFRDFDDTWYYYAGLYPYGYVSKGEEKSHFKIYRSCDRGKTWEDLGRGLDIGFRFEGDNVDSDGGPDAVVSYDERHGKYLLTYDNSTNDFAWSTAHNPECTEADSGAALVWGETPAGPFTRFNKRFLSNRRVHGCLGRFSRMYASAVFPRKKDYIAFCLCDSDQHFAWGLAVMTAPEPEGPWTLPHLVLSCDRPEYYPCPLEFYPVELYQGIVYANATSVARNRNYQGTFAAPLEHAQDPSAWSLVHDGNIWHAHDHPDEYYGIWGQTFHGFVEPVTGRYVVMFPSKDKKDCGTLSVAARPWNCPYSDGFTMTAHEGASISPLLTAYGQFVLEVEFEAKGTVDIAFDYHGILGPDDSCADSVPSAAALAGYTAIRISENSCMAVTVTENGDEIVYSRSPLREPASSVRIERQGHQVSVWINKKIIWEKLTVQMEASTARPLALILFEHSRITCRRFCVEGREKEYRLCYNAADALLGAGQLHPGRDIVDMSDKLSRDVWHRTPKGYVGEGRIAAKWNVTGDGFCIPFVKIPGFGKASIWVDGNFMGTVELCGEGETCWEIRGLEMGRHAVRVEPYSGRIEITRIYVWGQTTGTSYE